MSWLGLGKTSQKRQHFSSSKEDEEELVRNSMGIWLESCLGDVLDGCEALFHVIIHFPVCVYVFSHVHLFVTPWTIAL